MNPESEQLRRELRKEIASLTDDEFGSLISMMKFILENRERKKEGGTMYYRTCPYCGAALDPCERCDCQDERAEPMRAQRQKRTAPGGNDTRDGEMERNSWHLL